MKMTQYGFFFDQGRCTGCHACTISCKSWNEIPPGPVKWMRAYQWEKGVFPDIRLHILVVPCFHCEVPACVDACPNHAIYKERKYGSVLVDVEKCRGERSCWKACPYGSPMFQNDERGAKMSKCTMCIDRLEAGLKPICVLSCSLRALDFGPLDELRERYGTLRELEDMPSGEITKPAVVFKSQKPKKALIPWNGEKVLELWRGRGPFAPRSLSPVFTSKEEVTNVPKGLIGRDRLVLKANGVDELMYYTVDDE